MPETLFLSMNVIDRFLEKKAMTRKNLQLVSFAFSAECCVALSVGVLLMCDAS